MRFANLTSCANLYLRIHTQARPKLAFRSTLAASGFGLRRDNSVCNVVITRAQDGPPPLTLLAQVGRVASPNCSTAQANTVIFYRAPTSCLRQDIAQQSRLSVSFCIYLAVHCIDGATLPQGQHEPVNHGPQPDEVWGRLPLDLVERHGSRHHEPSCTLHGLTTSAFGTTRQTRLEERALGLVSAPPFECGSERIRNPGLRLNQVTW